MRALIVDLNNFSRYPTMSVGLLASILREAGVDVEVLSPFALGIKSYPRVERPRPWSLLDQILRYRTATSSSRWIRQARASIVGSLRPPNSSNHDAILSGLVSQLEAGTDIVLISAYTMYFDLCKKICSTASGHGVPVLVGGPYFSQPEIVRQWIDIPGVTALFGGEPESILVDLVSKLVKREEVASIPGVSLPGRQIAHAPPPRRDLDGIPFADYSDFPWEKYPNRIIPMMTGRGCGWGACKFCGDVVTAAGRRFQSRSPENVLEEMQHQHLRHDTRLFTFLDLKLNSNQPVWKALAEKTQELIPGAQWTASLHIDARCNDGLDERDLREARAGGLVRMTTGLESGSQRVLDAMSKGTKIERVSEVIHHAFENGISVRLTVMIGYPGEEVDDVLATARFLEQHHDFVDRVVLNRLTLMLGSVLQRDVESHPRRYPQLHDVQLNQMTATCDHQSDASLDKHHRRAVQRLLKAVHRINRKPLTVFSREFEGVM